ncbi:MAG: hypothetical protein E7062_05800 [Spirochaetaceae bacterium]|nr:hypothetical protein [Spirochaetaceae bacterium]
MENEMTEQEKESQKKDAIRKKNFKTFVWLLLIGSLLVLFGVPQMALRAIQKNADKKAQSQNSSLSATDNEIATEVNNVTAILTQEYLDNFVKNYGTISTAMREVKIPQQKNPSFEQLYASLEATGQLASVEETLKACGLGENPLLVYYTISTAYGVESINAMIAADPKLLQALSRMGGEEFEKQRKMIAQEDLDLIAENLDSMTETLRSFQK